MRSRILFTCACALFAQTLACTRSSTGGAEQRAWSNSMAVFIAGPSGAELRLSCAAGSAPGPVLLPRQGAFEVAGTFVEERGPQRTEHVVRFVGHVKGRAMELRVEREEPLSPVGPFDLVEGSREPLFQPCT
jgi:hypothetical protein